MAYYTPKNHKFKIKTRKLPKYPHKGLTSDHRHTYTNKNVIWKGKRKLFLWFHENCTKNGSDKQTHTSKLLNSCKTQNFTTETKDLEYLSFISEGQLELAIILLFLNIFRGCTLAKIATFNIWFGFTLNGQRLSRLLPPLAREKKRPSAGQRKTHNSRWSK